MFIALAPVVLVLSPLVTSCSRLVDGSLDVVSCDVELAYGEPHCPMGQTCVEGACIEAGGGNLTPCTSGEQCRSGLCLGPSSVPTFGEKRCATECCTSQDCGDPSLGWVCREVNGGQRICDIPEGTLILTSLGRRLGGSMCEADLDCRSNRCPNGRCEDYCCRDSDCAGGSCQFDPGAAGICDSE